MITGFNTDVEYEGVTYHVQTEDKGVETPLILSLVYHRGTILASKRSPYADLLKNELDEKILAERLQKQHKLICAAIRGGRLEDLKRMTMKDSEAKKAEATAAKINAKNDLSVQPATVKTAAPNETVEAANNLTSLKLESEEFNLPQRPVIAKTVEPANTQTPISQKSAPLRVSERLEQKIAEKIDRAKGEFSPPPKIIEAEPIFEAVEIIDEEMILPAEAVAVINDLPDARTLGNRQLEIGFLNETEFKGGDRKTVSIIVRRGQRENGTANAQVMVKILGSSFRPMIFHAKTDTNGVATVHLQLPHFRSGRAAILIRALSDGEEIEMRRIITHG